MENMQIKRDENGVSLLKEKGKLGLKRIIFSRLGVVLLLLVLQVLLLLTVFKWLEKSFIPYVIGGTILFTIGMVIYIVNSRHDPSAKITWLLLIMFLPVFGSLFYVYTQCNFGHHSHKVKEEAMLTATHHLVQQKPEDLAALAAENPGAAALAHYINSNKCHPVYRNTEVTYFPIGEAKWERMLQELEKAEHFIFMEYFILEEGRMWGKVLEILERKAKEGVDVRVMYDGTCAFSTVPTEYPEMLKSLGIQCTTYAPIIPLLSTHYNYRDHRKILVIDGHTAFTGGVNLADEYINYITVHGHWKDIAVMLKGEAARSFTLMFLQMWNLSYADENFKPFVTAPIPEREAPGYVIPYGDSPLDNDKVGQHVYMDMLNRAERYVHIMSPYLILDSTMEDALKFAAERGVDVKLILPGIPDKDLPFSLAKSHYKVLLESGVKIYEYTPGFVHAKCFIADDREAVVGTINLDYRSLYHHFECAAWMYQTPAIADIENDFEQTLAKSREITPETIWQGKPFLRPVSWVLKLVAPLL